MAQRKPTSKKPRRAAKKTTPKKAATKRKVAAKPRRKTAEVAQPELLLLLPSRAASIRWWQRITPLALPQLQMGGVAVMAVATVLVAAGLIQNIVGLGTIPRQTAAVAPNPMKVAAQLATASRQLSTLETLQLTTGGNVVDTGQLEQQLANAKFDLAIGGTTPARPLLTQLQHQLTAGNTQLAVSTAFVQPPATPVNLNVPILIYHQPPPDFSAQMAVLQQRNYTTVTLDQLAAALVGKGTLPPKPVVITFDDGFSAQLPAAALLATRHMKATFFIIDGGAASNYCIGAGRRPGACGDAYMTWNQIRQLDHNPLFTIASHTVDHLDLPTVPAAVQSFEIISGKQQLEQQLGHRVDDFAYPYGHLDATTLALVHQAGFIAAVTTQAGTTQTTGGLLTMPRIRATYDLP